MGQTSSKMSQISVVVVGAGSRGDNYSNFASIHPDRVKVVGVADPRKFARTKLQQKHSIQKENVFEVADAALICTPDRLHKDPAVAFAKKGYHILLEKPMAELIEAGAIGDVIHIQHFEPPTGAADRCLDCPIEPNCAYSASKIYLDRVKQGHTGWPVSVICPNSYPDIESVTEALKTGPYGRCVYECDNDVCTNQVVNMEFEGGLTAAFSMVAFTEKICQRQQLSTAARESSLMMVMGCECLTS
ncbi:hypothetical protein WMY93_030471 [Mugilogobius chulae]|uniref:Gfo/Idh/MocA-like oxidoreductase N-terminal domain-containing protein n=1 Tax=Mugilogobius chulae TaxID=88201 RepID=A0AAW0MH64_9GOBI